jgi:hypothetical protein
VPLVPSRCYVLDRRNLWLGDRALSPNKGGTFISDTALYSCPIPSSECVELCRNARIQYRHVWCIPVYEELLLVLRLNMALRSVLIRCYSAEGTATSLIYLGSNVAR